MEATKRKQKKTQTALAKAKPTKPSKKEHPRGNNKDHIFEVYRQWLMVPKVLRGLDEDRLRQLGVDSGIAFDLVQINTRTEFAKRYKVNRGTLAEWEKKIEPDEYFYSAQRMAATYANDVMAAFISKTIKYGDAMRVALWAKIVHDWQEKEKADPTKIPDTRPVIIVFEKSDYVDDVKPPPGAPPPPELPHMV